MIPEEWIDAIDARIAYRGPDGHGRFHERATVESPDGPREVEIALVHRRMSIIDLDGGAQPMISERGRPPTDSRDEEHLVAVTFNGCIYNHRELRKALQREGHHFQTDHSDTEVLLHGYRQWGEELAEHLEGMYAFAIWDRAKGSLMLARDFFGEKPLYVRPGVPGHRGVFAFASDARAIADLGGPLPDDQSADDLAAWRGTYLQLGYNWDRSTVYTGAPASVTSAPPTIVETAGELLPRLPAGSASQHEIEALIDQAVARRLEADVPLGCFLSGGVDSSLIAYFAKEHLGDLRTFSVRMPDERYDESAYAEQVADHLGVNHTTLDVSIDPAADLRFLIDTLGQPFGDSSILPTYWVSRAARQHVKVALSGDGGDELFFGYERHMKARAFKRHRRLFRWMPKRYLRGTHPKSFKHKLGRLGEMARDYRKLGVLAMESIFTQKQIVELCGDIAGGPRTPARQDTAGDPMLALRRCDLLNYLPDDLLFKVDTASMAVALEVRAPFLDRDLARTVLNQPTWSLAPKGKRKGLLRNIARKYLPDSIVDRPKMGFAIPIGEWFRTDFGGMKSLMIDSVTKHDAFGPIALNPGAVRSLIDEHMNDGIDHGQRLFCLLTLALWAQG